MPRAASRGSQVAKLDITASIAGAIGIRVNTLDEGSPVIKLMDFFDVVGGVAMAVADIGCHVVSVGV